MNKVHLAAALAALVIAGLGLNLAAAWATHVETRQIHALAATQSPLRNQGSALQRAAFSQPDLLVLYGSSELNIQEPYHASTLFASEPTGFTIFPVGKAGTLDLLILQDVAAGGDLHGKKVAISLSAPWFFGGAQGQDSYAGNFSDLHANALAWNWQFSMPTRQAAAKRMLAYPKTLAKDPLLRAGLTWLAGGKLWEKALYWLAWPLGQAHLTVLRLQDHWETLQELKKHPPKPAAPVHALPLDWAKLLTSATRDQEKAASNNPFGFDNRAWNAKLQSQLAAGKGKRKDSDFVRSVNLSPEWGDLRLLLQGLRELGAEPLLLSMPMQGEYYDYLGVSRQGRQAYYDRLAAVSQEMEVPLQDFPDHDQDKYFLIDPGAHLSRRGWIFYAQALDAFMHGLLH